MTAPQQHVARRWPRCCLIAEQDLAIWWPAAPANAPNPTGSATSGTDNSPHCSAASTAWARRRSVFRRCALVFRREHRQQPPAPQLAGLLCDEVGARLLDRAQNTAKDRAPTVCTAHQLRGRRSTALRLAAPVISANHSPSAPLNSSTAITSAKAHDVDQIMRLITPQGDILPVRQWQPRRTA